MEENEDPIDETLLPSLTQSCVLNESRWITTGNTAYTVPCELIIWR